MGRNIILCSCFLGLHGVQECHYGCYNCPWKEFSFAHEDHTSKYGYPIYTLETQYGHSIPLVQTCKSLQEQYPWFLWWDNFYFYLWILALVLQCGTLDLLLNKQSLSLVCLLEPHPYIWHFHPLESQDSCCYPCLSQNASCQHSMKSSCNSPYWKKLHRTLDDMPLTYEYVAPLERAL